jgi:hypothetical protein
MSESIQNNILEAGTYEIIRDRLQAQKQDLLGRLEKLNDARKQVFGSVETSLIAQNRIATENNCISQDIVAIGNLCILGYNVHFGLRTDIKLNDVFSAYLYKNGEFEATSLEIISQEGFVNDFTSLYKYYRNTRFYRFIVIGNYLYMVFQLSESITDIKTFKWLIADGKLTYIDNRSDFEYRFPNQHDFAWVPTTRDLHKYGKHPHVAILNKVFVDAVGGSLSIKVEDNTNEGEGIYNEPVLNADQTLDDASYLYADLGNLIALDIKPFQEESRFFVYNHKLREVKRIDSVKNAAILLPDNQGIIFSNGYYLQSGDYKIFENSLNEVVFQERISSPNGEDFLYIFFQRSSGRYVLMQYNVITQSVNTPIVCNGYALLPGGRLCYFLSEEEQTRSHVMQVWQTPFTEQVEAPAQFKDSLIFKIGNKDIVRAMAESKNLVTLLNKEDSYSGLYADLVRNAQNILDGYYWIRQQEVYELSVPLEAIKSTANAAIDEFEKVTALRQTAMQSAAGIKAKVDSEFIKLKGTSFRSIEDFVEHLATLRNLRGEVISMEEIRYIDKDLLQKLENEIVEQTDRISLHCVNFLSDEKALMPFTKRVGDKRSELDGIDKVLQGRKLEKEVGQIGTDLEMLIEIVSNLKIEDTSMSTKIIENISLIFTTLNQLKAAIRNKISGLASNEASAEFAAQVKLVDQTIVNYLDIADTPEKADELFNKLAVQLEELEARFADYDAFIGIIIEKREEAGSAFDNRKNQLVEARNKRAISIETAAQRIIKGIIKKAETLNSQEQINGYFAGDLMIGKLRDLAQQLRDMEDAGRAETIETAMKSAKEEALRKLKDKQELFEDGDNVIKLGNHRFAVNKQALDLTIVYRDHELYYHLTGTDFYQPVESSLLHQSERFWDQPLVSENATVYRSAYLAWKLWKRHTPETLFAYTEANLQQLITEELARCFDEGYTKGVHDVDALKILRSLLNKHHDLGLLRYAPRVRAIARFFWESLSTDQRQQWNQRIKGAGQVLNVFPGSVAHKWLIDELALEVGTFVKSMAVLVHAAHEMDVVANYLFDDLRDNDLFVVSIQAFELYEQLTLLLTSVDALVKFRQIVDHAISYNEKVQLSMQWVSSFMHKKGYGEFTEYAPEVASLLLLRHEGKENLIAERAHATIDGLTGAHPTLSDGKLIYNYHEWIGQLDYFYQHEVPAFEAFRKERQNLIHQQKVSMRLKEFEPKVLSSFVRNKLINEVYLPLIGNNLARQLGAVGDNLRTDRSGMLLLVSPPGYGKTTLMEYVANRLGLIFMKINGPALGHNVTSVDPQSADNSAAREELKKLNLGLEMGNNVMLYVDDIQHCNTEFLQKFISLADGTRKMEGVYNNTPRTYDMKGKRFCVVMAGNPYTESGDKFQIPDMLANRSDTYNLGDIIGNTAESFKLSLIENAVTSNPLLSQLAAKKYSDLYVLIKMAEAGTMEGFELEGNHSKQEVETYISLLKKIIRSRDVVLKVNELYITSAAQDDAYRTEPPFKLQGSYRDMNKIVSKVMPIMNDDELEALLLTHYRNESQTLTNAAEANMLKYRELSGIITAEEKERWESIKETFVKNNKLKGMGEGNNMAMLLSQVMEFTGHLGDIKDFLKEKNS